MLSVILFFKFNFFCQSVATLCSMILFQYEKTCDLGVNTYIYCSDKAGLFFFRNVAVWSTLTFQYAVLSKLASPHPGYDFDKLKSYLIRPPGRGVLKRLDSANPYFIFPYAHLGTFYIILK